jgi:hypothetical protein
MKMRSGIILREEEGSKSDEKLRSEKRIGIIMRVEEGSKER